jgi:hypothetical protein
LLPNHLRCPHRAEKGADALMRAVSFCAVEKGEPQRNANLLIDLFGWQLRCQDPAINNGHSIHAGSSI